MIKGASAFLLFSIVYYCATASEGERLSGDSSIFGNLKETHTEEFSGERGVKVIEDKVFLFNKKDTINRIEVLNVPSLKSIWSLNGSYSFIQPCEGKRSYAILYISHYEAHTIDVYEMSGKRLFTLPYYDGGMLATPNGELFYPSDWGINGTGIFLYNRFGEKVPGHLCCYRGDEVARSLNDTVIVVGSFASACIFSITDGKIFDSIPYPTEFGGGCAGRSKLGGHVLLNWRGGVYYVDSSMKFQRIEDSAIYANRAIISQNGKLGFLYAHGQKHKIFSYQSGKLKRSWTEIFDFDEGHYFGDFELITLKDYLIVPHSEFTGRKPNQIITPKILVLRLDSETGQQLERITFDETFRVGSLADGFFTVSAETAENKTKVTLRVWE